MLAQWKQKKPLVDASMKIGASDAQLQQLHYAQSKCIFSRLAKNSAEIENLQLQSACFKDPWTLRPFGVLQDLCFHA